jgi:hypothetical protein
LLPLGHQQLVSHIGTAQGRYYSDACQDAKNSVRIARLLRMPVNMPGRSRLPPVDALKSRDIKKNVLGKIFGNFRSSWDIKDVETRLWGQMLRFHGKERTTAGDNDLGDEHQ